MSRYLVDLILFTEANLKWQWNSKSDHFSPTKWKSYYIPILQACMCSIRPCSAITGQKTLLLSVQDQWTFYKRLPSEICWSLWMWGWCSCGIILYWERVWTRGTAWTSEYSLAVKLLGQKLSYHIRYPEINQCHIMAEMSRCRPTAGRAVKTRLTCCPCNSTRGTI